MTTTTHCFNCNKPLDSQHAERIGIEVDGKPEEIHEFCHKCAHRLVRNVIRLEKQQQGVLIA